MAFILSLFFCLPLAQAAGFEFLNDLLLKPPEDDKIPAVLCGVPDTKSELGTIKEICLISSSSLLVNETVNGAPTTFIRFIYRAGTKAGGMEDYLMTTPYPNQELGMRMNRYVLSASIFRLNNDEMTQSFIHFAFDTAVSSGALDSGLLFGTTPEGIGFRVTNLRVTERK